MGCSHSLREEKLRIIQKKHPPLQTPFMPIESKAPRTKHKIALKAITESTRQSPKVKASIVPVPTVPTPLKTPKTRVESFISPYRIDSQQYYGYGGVAQEWCCEQKGGGRGQAYRYRNE